MDNVKERTRSRVAKAGAQPAKPAEPHKPGPKSTAPVDENTRVLIDAIKGLKGLR